MNGRPDAVVVGAGPNGLAAALGALAEKVVAGDTDPYTAADELVGQL